MTYKTFEDIVDGTPSKLLKEKCLYCNGTGLLDDSSYDGDTYSRGTFCDTCGGTGKVKLLTKSPKQDWEIEFDKKFNGRWFVGGVEKEVRKFISKLLSQTKSQIVEHSEDKLRKSYIKLSESEKRLLCQKGSLVGTDSKNPKEKLVEYVEELLGRSKSQIVEQILEIKPKKSKMGYACGNCGDFLDDEVSNYCSTCGYKVKRN